MKNCFVKLTVICVVLMNTVQSASAQQQSITSLILTGFNSAHQGFPSFINDTLPYDGWNNKINTIKVKQYAGVKDIELKFEKNYKSRLMNDTLVKLNQMKIRGESIILERNKFWDDYKDTLTSYYNNIVSFYQQAFGKQLNYSQIIPLDNPKNADFKPRYIIYFYEKKLTLPETLTNMYEIEKQLDVISWFTIELQEQPLTHNYNIVYRISGGQRQ